MLHLGRRWRSVVRVAVPIVLAWAGGFALVSSMGGAGIASAATGTATATDGGTLEFNCNSLGPQSYCWVGSYDHTKFYNLNTFSDSGNWSVNDFLVVAEHRDAWISQNWGVSCPTCVNQGVGLTYYDEAGDDWPQIYNPDPNSSHSFDSYAEYSGSLG